MKNKISNNIEINNTNINNLEIKNQAYFINKINFMHFSNKNIFIYFKHKKYGQSTSISVEPKPCVNEKLHCAWITRDEYNSIDVNNYDYQYLLISDDKEVIIAEPKLIKTTQEEILFELPEKCSRYLYSEGKLYSCDNIQVTICQNSAFFRGELLEFNPLRFLVSIEFMQFQAMSWIDCENPVVATLHEEGISYYSGECKIVNAQEKENGKNIIYELSPLKTQAPRFKKKECRNFRQKLKPSPDFVFYHPITKKKLTLKVDDISGSGISVVEPIAHAQLLAGMIIPEGEIRFAVNFTLKCALQVVYCDSKNEKNGVVVHKSGMALLDMDRQDHINLISILQQANDEHSYVCNEVDMESLWNFFFSTGFIYPQKYDQIIDNIDNFKETYTNIYCKNPQISRHFIHQVDGEIVGHMAMIRFYHNTWMIHHHTANGDKSQFAGVKVLSQLIRYANNVSNLASAHMRYVFSYYRSENKFPRRVLGGIANYLKDPQKSSLDTFAYLISSGKGWGGGHLPDNWKLEKPCKNDLLELKYFYEAHSNGLLLDAFELCSIHDPSKELADEYHKLGHKKEKYIFCLKESNELIAVYLVNISDIGLNMSDLTNCLKVIIVNGEKMTQEIFQSSINSLLPYFEMDDIPILVYPTSWLKYVRINIKKYYTLWILDLNYIDQYVKYYQRLLGRNLV